MIANSSMAMVSDYVRENELASGLRYCHRQLDANARKAFEALAYSYSVTEVLIAKGIVGIEELDRRRHAAIQRLAERYQQEQIGVYIGDQVGDKYCLGEHEVAVDCEARHPICRAVCCKLEFALSTQDIEEGIVRWNLGEPYLNRKGESGRCVHLDLETYKCTVYENRPSVCRSYNCRNDERIWLDFEKRVINPAMFQSEPT
jgi:Fe-S-cluster containining protein